MSNINPRRGKHLPAMGDPSTNMPVLTIAIPSYNRNGILSRNLALLLPQLNHECVLTIIDNASDTPLRETLTCLESFTACPVNIIRHRVNIGGSANILRCFETCETEWLWILSDDDPVSPDAVRTILDQTNGDEETLFVYFRPWNQSPNRSLSSHGLSEFIRSVDVLGIHWGWLLCVSTAIYRCRFIKPHLLWGYQYAFSCAPHLVTLMAALGHGGRCKFQPDTIVRGGQPERDQHWAMRHIYVGLGTLMDLPFLTDQDRDVLGPQLRKCFVVRLMGINLLADYVCGGMSRRSIVRVFDQCISRTELWRTSFVSRLSICAWRLALTVPRVSVPTLQWVARIVYGKSFRDLLNKSYIPLGRE